MPIVFTRHENTITTSALWRVDEVRAHLDSGEQAGYCRISYVPSDRIEGWDNDIYAFLAHRGGALGIHGIKDPSRASHQTWSALAFAVQCELHGWPKANASAWHEKPLDEIRDFLEAARPGLEKKVGPKRAEFIDFHVDKPLVDYIQVVEGLQGKRIGRTLYQEAARWMGERGLSLHASGIQTESARRCWESMAREGLVEPTGVNRIRLKMG